ncbi:MAG: hypothetical protein FWK04_14430 [Nostoc sp. GBBB01]|nr:hypothetical protein [Nostoc sp. GBBB01]
MSIWIVTIGNSDVQLKTNDNWENFYIDDEDVKYNTDIQYCDDKEKLGNLVKDDATNLFPVPARVLGIVYEKHLEKNYNDLAFPLLDTFSLYFEKNQAEKPSKIIILLTDQKNIFSDDGVSLNKKAHKQEAPYWQDTSTLEHILKKYFETKPEFTTKPIFKTLIPESSKGLDHWEDTLTAVKKIINQVQNELRLDPKYNAQEPIYVSHQAGTPAISSAIQFVSLSEFKNVKFLLSNIFYEDYERKSEPDLVDVSHYWRGIQIQKAKQLVIDGLPAGALELLKEIDYVDNNNVKLRLQRMISVFNIRTSFTKGDEFNVEDAIQRVVDALALIELFFKEKNYIQGITLLAAAHETFLKAAIVNAIKDKVISVDVNGITKKFKSHQLVQWQQPGLLFIRNPQDKYIDDQLKSALGISGYFDFEKMIAIKLKILGQLSFPITDFDKQLKKGKIDLMNSNNGLFKWLCKLYPKFQYWSLLEWSCVQKDDKKEHEHDIRNQLMHNLLGVNEQQVIKYLLGNPDKFTENDVSQVYEQAVKVKFLNEIRSLNFIYKPRKFYEELEAIANDI